MELCVKTFDELSTRELYDILLLRVNVFVVEQRCPYPELDGLDRTALHVWLRDGDDIAAYLRVMPRGEGKHAAIGRVIAVRRRQGLGTRVLREGIRLARERFGAEDIYLEAQTYARSLYEKQGFRPVTEEFLEDGIPHVGMLLDLGEEA